MTVVEAKNYSHRLGSLIVFRSLLEDPVISSLESFLTQVTEDAYAEFVSKLLGSGCDSIGDYLSVVMRRNENAYIRTVGRGDKPGKVLTQALQKDLETLQFFATLPAEDLIADLGGKDYLPLLGNSRINLVQEYKRRAAHIGQYGYGVYSEFSMFYLDGDNHVTPVRNPDGTRLTSLIDYKREQEIILENTRALLAGKPAANILLTGDAGTGKSSTIKAVVNELSPEGLRILEVRKEQLHSIPSILDELSENPLKFIIFIDDLSFQKNDDNYSALKAILEGSVSAKPSNVVIYATSNRRHLVKETFSDRDGDDVHRNDTLQEVVSLSERFGIHISYQKPDKTIYLDIVHHLAENMGITVPIEEMDLLAERFALERGGRSARAARQFVEGLKRQN